MVLKHFENMTASLFGGSPNANERREPLTRGKRFRRISFVGQKGGGAFAARGQEHSIRRKKGPHSPFPPRGRGTNAGGPARREGFCRSAEKRRALGNHYVSKKPIERGRGGEGEKDSRVERFRARKKRTINCFDHRVLHRTPSRKVCRGRGRRGG